MASAGDFFTQQWGPLPAGVWILAVGGGLAVAYYVQSQSPDSDTSGVEGGGTDTSAAGGVPGVGRGPGTPGFLNIDRPPEPEPEPELESNEDWAQMVIAGMIGESYGPSLVDTAIRNYISNADLTDREHVIVNEALAKYGPPPDVLGPTTDIPPEKDPVTGKPEPKPKPEPEPKPKPKRHPRFHTVKRGDTLWDIAAHYYNDAGAWRAIYNHNRGKISNPDLIYPGQRLRIPDLGKPGLPPGVPQHGN